MKIIRIIIITVLLTYTAGAQNNPQKPRSGGDGPRKEQLESMKIGFITEKVNLTPEEAQVFWPVYNKYSDELKSIRKDRRENLMNARDNFDSMSDAEIEKAVDMEIAARSAEAEILKKYNPQFKKILPIRKVAKLYKAEEEFKRKLVEMIRERRDYIKG